MPTTKTFNTAELLDMDMPWEAPEGGKIISDKIVGQRRWSTDHELIVRFPDQPEDQAWSFGYSVGSTEGQDEGPWEYEKETTATLMQLKEVTVKKWVPAE